jgi:hypothetical protein
MVSTVHVSISGKEKKCLCSPPRPDRLWGNVREKCDTDEGRRWEKTEDASFGNGRADGEDL